MREINNTHTNGINPVPQVKKTETPVAPQEAVAENAKEIKDLANTPAESLGRSQVAQRDNLENDLKVLLDAAGDPEKLNKAVENLEKANKFYEITAKTVGDEKALALMKAYAEEFAK